MEPRMPPGRLARWSASALWPLAIAVPLTPVLLSLPARASRSTAAQSGFVGVDDFLVQLLALESVLLIGTLSGAMLVRARMRRSGDRWLTRHESWAVLALALGGVASTVGMTFAASGSAGPGGAALIDGTWTVVVAIGALIVLPLKELRRGSGGDAATARERIEP